MRERLIAIIKDSLFRHVDKSCNLAENIADDLLKNGVVVLPCKLGDEIKGEIVCEIDYFESLMATGEIHISKKIYTCDKNDARKIILCSHPMSWEEAERALKGGAE